MRESRRGTARQCPRRSCLVRAGSKRIDPASPVPAASGASRGRRRGSKWAVRRRREPRPPDLRPLSPDSVLAPAPVQAGRTGEPWPADRSGIAATGAPFCPRLGRGTGSEPLARASRHRPVSSSSSKAGSARSASTRRTASGISRSAPRQASRRPARSAVRAEATLCRASYADGTPVRHQTDQDDRSPGTLDGGDMRLRPVAGADRWVKPLDPSGDVVTCSGRSGPVLNVGRLLEVIVAAGCRWLETVPDLGFSTCPRQDSHLRLRLRLRSAVSERLTSGHRLWVVTTTRPVVSSL